MPNIRESRKKLYPGNWPQISARTKAEAGNKCEICDVRNKSKHPLSGALVVLTVHHLDFDPSNNEYWNLIALCQRCHNRIEKKYRAFNAKQTLAKRKAKKGKE